MRDHLPEALDIAYRDVLATFDDRGEADFARPTRTAAWTVKELLFHLTQDAVRALMAFADQTDDEPDVDAITYWHPFRPGQAAASDVAADIRFVQVSASAHSYSRMLLLWWARVSHAAVQAALRADQAGRVRTQGHVLAVPDFISTLLVEATIHHLDLTVDLSTPPQALPPTAAGLAETRRVLEGLLGAPLPISWDDTEAALKGTGRVPLSAADRVALGDRAAAIPLLG